MKRFNLGFMQGRLVDSEKKGRIQFFPANNWAKEIKIAHNLGFQFMEWTIDDDNLSKNPIYNGNIKNLKKILTKYKFKIPSITLDYFMQRPFFKANLKNRKIIINNLEKIFRNGRKIGIKKYIIPLVDNSSIENIIEENDLIIQLKKISRKFNTAQFLFESDYKPNKLLNFIKKFKSKKFGINYDTGNSASLDYDFSEEKVYFKYVKNIHIKDRKKKSTTVRLGQGNWNYKKFFNFIRKKKYSGNFILQTARSKKKKNIKEILINKNFFEKHYFE